MTNISSVTTSIDYEKDGKQVSYLGVPISTNESAYGTITLPIIVIKNGSGPTVLLSGGIHGDEYEGQVAIRNLAQKLNPSDVQGRIIFTPSLNLPAALAGTRCSPMDGLNLNRVFPGDPNGSITVKIAHYISSVLLPLCDAQLDLHSGGTTLDFIPFVQMIRMQDKSLHDRSFEALKVCGAPVSLVTTELDSTGNIAPVCEELGIVYIGSEMGGAGSVSKTNVGYAETAALNFLRHFRVIDGPIVTPEEQGRAASRLMTFTDVSSYVMAPDGGLFEPFFEMGDDCRSGQSIGQVHYLEHGQKAPWEVEATSDGVLLSKRPPGMVKRGDNVAIIAQDLQEE
jgi:predicted deacylase